MDTPVALEVGQSVDRFRIEAVLGRGGMATVYLARHTHLDSLHAIKVLDITGPGLHRRLMLEGRTQAALRHPNIVAVSDVVELGRWLGLVMDFVRGPTLAGLIDARPLSLRQAHELGTGILAGVGAAHALGVVHRDLKPANILLELGKGRVTPKITDFGLAKAGAVERSHTRTGATMGTPPYMAPEQVLDARDVDHRCDVFALGAIFYELLTGVVAFERGSAFETMQAVSRGERRPIEELRPGLPSAMIEAVDAALIVDRDARCPDVAALAALWAAAGASPELGGSGPVWTPEALERLDHMAPILRPASIDQVSLSPSGQAKVALATQGPDSVGWQSAHTDGTWIDEPGEPRRPSLIPDRRPGQTLVKPTSAPPAPTPAPTAPAPSTLPRSLQVLLAVAAVLGTAGLAAGRLLPQMAPTPTPAALVIPAPPAVDPPEVAPLQVDPSPPRPSAAPTPAPVAPSLPPASPAAKAPPPTLSATGKPLRPDPQPAADTRPAPEPAPAATPPPAEPAEPPPPKDEPRSIPVTAKVKVSGTAQSVWLRSDRGNIQAGRGPVPPGTWHVYAIFPGDPASLRMLDITVTAGQTVTIDCDKEQAKCRVL